jgi:division protein 1
MRALITSTTTNAASSTQMLADLAPQLLQHRMLVPNLASASAYTRATGASTSKSLTASAASLVRRLPRGHDAAPPTSISLAIRERANELLQLPIPMVPGPSNPSDAVSLLTGFRATAPSSNAARLKRRRRRAGLSDENAPLTPQLAIEARPPTERPVGRRQSAIGLGTPKKHGRRKSLAFTTNANGGEATLPDMSREELELEVAEILQDQANLEVRKVRSSLRSIGRPANVAQVLLSSEIGDVDRKIAALETVRAELRRGLLGLREEHLALEDERAFACLSGLRHLSARSRGDSRTSQHA